MEEQRRVLVGNVKNILLFSVSGLCCGDYEVDLYLPINFDSIQCFPLIRSLLVELNGRPSLSPLELVAVGRRVQIRDGHADAANAE